MTNKEKVGHRERLRERFLSGEAEARSDEMLLELLLSFAIGRKDVRPLAQELVHRFGSLSQVLSASPAELERTKGIGQASVALLKLVNFIQTGALSVKGIPAMPKVSGASQQSLFETSADGQAPPTQIIESQSVVGEEIAKPEIPQRRPEVVTGTSRARGSRKPPKLSEKPLPPKKVLRPKLQVSNGYLMEFDQLARVLHFLLEHRHKKKISRKALQEDTGLADRQVESLVSMGSAMGLIKPGLQVLTTTGLLIAQHDIFFENKGTLEWCHYKAAGSYQNLVWFEVFNHLLAEEPSMDQVGWQEHFRKRLKGQYTDKTIKRHLPKEIRFVIDAYMKRNFSKLGLLHQSADERLYSRRYTGFAPPVLAAMIYDFSSRNEAQLSQIGDMASTPGSPAVVFGLDAVSFRQQIEPLHDRGWVRYETTHNLDQIRLKPGFAVLEFLSAHFEEREPNAFSHQLSGGIIR